MNLDDIAREDRERMRHAEEKFFQEQDHARLEKEFEKVNRRALGSVVGLAGVILGAVLSRVLEKL